ncbi:MAG TPA: Na+/H+ antiporter NhaA [Caulobacteraceae bacterium]|nr:Na+/H+ antiporter NhaA [Caulobacteraceae bacterium]
MRRLTLDYLKTESGSGLLLAEAALAAVGVANSRLGGEYFSLLATPVPVQVGDFAQTLSLADWVRALLMPVFFFVLGMELKFELLRGELSGPRRLALPAIAAIGGLALPAALYVGLNRDDPTGWGVGCATDGAAALTAFSLAGPRLAHSLRVLLMSVAIAGNLAAVVFTAILDDGALDDGMLVGAGVVLVALAVLGRWRRAPFLFYAAGFLLVWGFTLKSGLDTAMAGVACAFAVPVGTRRPGQDSMLRYFMESLHGYVAFAVRPIFVFTVVGVAWRQLRFADLGAAAPLGVLLALAIGKPLGVFTASAAAIGLRLARRPTGAKWLELFGVALLSGSGGPVSYYIAGMAGPASPAVRTAILIGSTLTAVSGAMLLASADRARAAEISN